MDEDEDDESKTVHERDDVAVCSSYCNRNDKRWAKLDIVTCT